jgi:hypothetical protein
LNRGIRGGEIQNQMQRDYDLGLNQAMSLAALDAVQGGREEYSFLSGEASKKRQQTLYERLTQANLQNQAQQMMAETNLGAYGAEAMARYQQGQLAESAAARAMAAQQQDLASRLQAASMLWSQNMGAYQQMFGNLAQLAGFGGGQGLAYSLGSPVDVTGASNSAMNNAMFGWQSSPLGIATELGGTLGSAALGGKG